MLEWKTQFPKNPVPGGHNSTKAVLARTVNQGIFTASGSKGNIQNWRHRLQTAIKQHAAHMTDEEKIDLSGILHKTQQICNDLKQIEEWIYAFNERKKGAKNEHTSG